MKQKEFYENELNVKMNAIKAEIDAEYVRYFRETNIKENNVKSFTELPKRKVIKRSYLVDNHLQAQSIDDDNITESTYL